MYPHSSTSRHPVKSLPDRKTRTHAWHRARGVDPASRLPLNLPLVCDFTGSKRLKLDRAAQCRAYIRHDPDCLGGSLCDSSGKRSLQSYAWSLSSPRVQQQPESPSRFERGRWEGRGNNIQLHCTEKAHVESSAGASTPNMMLGTRSPERLRPSHGTNRVRMTKFLL